MNRGFTNEIKGEVTVLVFCSEYEAVPSVIPITTGTLWLNKHTKKALNCFRACGDKWTRTIDSRIFSPMLYQLSYITLFVK